MSSLDRKRWLVLTCMFCLGLMQCVGWMTYSGDPRIAAEYYGFENPKASIDMLLNWGPIMYLPVAPVVGYLVAKHAANLWPVILAGAALTALGLCLRLVPNIVGMAPESGVTHILVHTGQAFNGAAGPMNCVTPSALAAMWFPASQRSLATSAVYAVQMAGPSVGFLLALNIRTSDHLVLLMFVEAGFAVAVLLAWALLPREPKVPPSHSQEMREFSHTENGRLPVHRWISTVVLVLAGSFSIGVFQCWSPALPTQLQGVLPESLLKWFAIITATASVLGSCLCPPLLEALQLQWRLKSAMAVMLLVQIVAFSVFAASLPDSPVAVWKTVSPAWLMTWLVLASVAEGAVAPMVYELSAELTYPHSEGLTGAAFSWLLNFFGFVLLWIFPAVPPRYDSLMMMSTCVVSLILLGFVKAEYPRRMLDENERAGLLPTA